MGFLKSGEEDHILSNDEEYFFAQLEMIKEPSVQCMGSMRSKAIQKLPFEFISGR